MAGVLLDQVEVDPAQRVVVDPAELVVEAAGGHHLPRPGAVRDIGVEILFGVLGGRPLEVPVRAVVRAVEQRDAGLGEPVRVGALHLGHVADQAGERHVRRRGRLRCQLLGLETGAFVEQRRPVVVEPPVEKRALVAESGWLDPGLVIRGHPITVPPPASAGRASTGRAGPAPPRPVGRSGPWRRLVRSGLPGQNGRMRIIRAARLWDGTSDRAIMSPLLAVDPDGRIAGVASGGDVPTDAEVIDLGEATLLPGLIDGHQHLIFDASLDPVGRLDTVDDAEALDGMRLAASVALNAGVTTVRDLGDRNFLAVGLREEFAGAPGSGPRLLSAGPPLTTPRGHCWFLGGAASGIDAIREGVRARAERGVDVLKVMASGGEMTEGTHSYESQFSVDELRAAVDEAHGLGLRVTAHAHGVGGIANAVAAGVDLIEHCSFLLPEGVSLDEEVLGRLVDSGVTVSMTLGQVPGQPTRPRMAVLLPRILAGMARMRAAGVPLVCSSDAGIGPAKPHDVLPYSAEVAVEAVGATPIEALRMVTSGAAAACGIDDRAGRLAAGFDADLLAVEGDPLTDIAALRNVGAVFRAGHRVR